MSDNNGTMNWTSQILVGESIDKTDLQNFVNSVPDGSKFKFEPWEDTTIVIAEWSVPKQ